MRELDTIVIHCSATYPNQDYGVKEIREMHLKKGWSDIGYHFVVQQDGSTQVGRPIEKIGAHVRGNNSKTVGICYIGGLDDKGKAKDTRTDKQKESLLKTIKELIEIYPTITKVVGHRDYSPDLNKDGVVNSWERIKECPCFDAIPEYKNLTK